MSEEISTSKLPPPDLSTAGPKAAFLVVLKSDSSLSIGHTVRIAAGDFILGRSDELPLPLGDESISRRHARIFENVAGEYVIEDLESTNGTFVNGSRTTTSVLHDGDKLQLGSGAMLLFTLRDELEEQFQKQLYEAATRDGLTGLTNKSLFLASLELELAHSSRRGIDLAVAMIDVDLFKNVNDTYGHVSGDQALRAIAETLIASTREGDLVARYGGEEFTWLFRGLGFDKAMARAETYRAAIEAQEIPLPDGTRLRITVSIGVAASDGGARVTGEALIGAADAELYRAKQAGRNRVIGRRV